MGLNEDESNIDEFVAELARASAEENMKRKVVREPFAEESLFVQCGEFRHARILPDGFYVLTLGKFKASIHFTFELNMPYSHVLAYNASQTKASDVQEAQGLFSAKTGRFAFYFLLNNCKYECRGKLSKTRVIIKGRARRNNSTIYKFSLFPLCSNNIEGNGSSSISEIKDQKIRIKIENVFEGEVYNAESEENECAVCCDNCIDCVLGPCGHLCICSSCSIKIEICPLCRMSVDEIIIPE